MAYDRTDPAAWWSGAEPLPPKPDEPDAPGGLRVGDRLQRVKPDVGEGDTVLVTAWEDGAWTARGESGLGEGLTFAVKPEYIGPVGSGRPWTLLARNPVPEPSPVPPASDTRAWARIFAARDAHERSAKWRGNLGAMAAALRAADAVLETRVDAGETGNGPSVAPGVGQVVRVYARDGRLLGVVPPGAGFIADVDAVPDPRREALERLAKAARAFGGSDDRSFVDRLAGLCDALAALDGEGGAP